MGRRFPRSLHVFALFGFAVGQPLFDLLSGNAAFLVAHRLRPADLLVLVAILCLVLPGLPVLLETLAGFLHRRAGDYVHQLATGLLVGAIALQAFKALFTGPGTALAVAALLVGLPVGWASCRVRLVERFLTFLWPSIVVFPALFLLRPPVSDLLFVERELPALRGGVSSDIPIVLLVFDELPTSSLMDEHRQINAFRYPNFAALARDSHWFRNASTVAETTELAVPAMLTGRYPKRIASGIAANYPENLFTWLGGDYRLNVFETATRICPEKLCSETMTTEGFEERIRSTIFDLGYVYLHVILPVDLSEDLPSVRATMRDFGGTDRTAKADPQADRRRPRKDGGWVFPRFVDSIQPARHPVLHFLHIYDLPHVPYEYLPSGKRYSAVRTRLPVSEYRWGSDEWQTVQFFQRHLLQVGYADRLLGTLLRRLREVGLYDRSLVIVVADHGASFWPNQPHRIADQKNWADILAVPLLVKLPHQREPVVSDRNIEIIDILPTIADVLGTQLPWGVDGQSALDRHRSKRGQKLISRDTRWKRRWNLLHHGPSRKASEEVEHMFFNPGLEWLTATVERKVSLFGSGEDPRSIYRIGRFRSLMGRGTEQLGYAGPKDLELKLKNEWRFQEVHIDGPFIPVQVAGQIHSRRGSPNRLHLAVAVNGGIEAVTRTYKGPEGPWSFTAMVPETVFKAGANRVEVFVISGTEDRPRLASLRKKDPILFSLVEAQSGTNEESIVSSTGETIRIVPGAMRGVVEQVQQPRGYSRVSGWASDGSRRRPADRVAVFVDGEANYERHATVSRSDLVEGFKAPSSIFSSKDEPEDGGWGFLSRWGSFRAF